MWCTSAAAVAACHACRVYPPPGSNSTRGASINRSSRQPVRRNDLLSPTQAPSLPLSTASTTSGHESTSGVAGTPVAFSTVPSPPEARVIHDARALVYLWVVTVVALAPASLCYVMCERREPPCYACVTACVVSCVHGMRTWHMAGGAARSTCHVAFIIIPLPYPTVSAPLMHLVDACALYAP